MTLLIHKMMASSKVSETGQQAASSKMSLAMSSAEQHAWILEDIAKLTCTTPWICKAIGCMWDGALAARDVGLEEGIGSRHGLHVAGLQGRQQDIVARRLHIPTENLQHSSI